MQATSLVETETLALNETPPRRSAASPTVARTLAQRGQMLVVFVMAIFVIIGLVGVVIDISWYWTNTLRVQRAADAAALAGAVQLPTRPTDARDDAQAQAGKNGYPSLPMGCSGDNPTGVPGMCAHQDSTNRNQMNVTISAPVGTFFMRVFGIQNITATRSSKALYTLPVPMGSPENYYGVFGDVRNATMTNVTTQLDPPGSWTQSTSSGQAAGPATATTSPGTATWTVTPTSPSRTLAQAVETNETSGTIYYAQSASNGANQEWGDFGFLSSSAIPADVAMPSPTNAGDQSKATNIVGLQVLLADARRTATCANSRIGVSLSWNGGSNWSTVVNTGLLGTSTTSGDYTLGNNSNTSPWGSHSWSSDDFSDANFRVRLTAIKGCSTASVNLQVDQLRVTPYYTVTTTTATETTTTNTTTATYRLRGPGTACANGVAGCYLGTPAGNGQVLNPRGFWATMNTQGSANVNGDAYQPYYDTATSTAAQTCPSAGNACYDPVNYYNYAVKMPAGTSGGRIFVFDPTFCATAAGSGTGDRWFSGTTAVSSWYEVWTDPNNTPYDNSDDSLLTTSGSTFQDIRARDSSMGGGTTGGSNPSECLQRDDMAYGDARDYHNSWYLLASGLSGGITYRVHTTSSGAVDQRSTNGEQSFAIFADNTEGQAVASRLPQVYGLGAMQMFTPLTSNGGTTNSDFYLAQVPEFYAGKLLEINLWDPGDTNPLAARLYIQRPTTFGWTDTEFTYAASAGTTGGANTACNSNSNSSPTNMSVLTNVGSTTGSFNGCWLTLTIPIPTNYSGDQDGWWKIKYAMTGSGTSNDVTTWTAAIKGNPVHLVVP